jgi:hypothetical protein
MTRSFPGEQTNTTTSSSPTKFNEATLAIIQEHIIHAITDPSEHNEPTNVSAVSSFDASPLPEDLTGFETYTNDEAHVDSITIQGHHQVSISTIGLNNT